MKAVSLFSNCGAGDAGYAAAGFEFKVISEIVQRRLKVASLNHPNATAVQGDLRITWPVMVDAYREAHGSEPPTLLSGCPPCQGMSSARGGRGREEDADAGSCDGRNLLVLPIARVAVELNQPSLLSRMCPRSYGAKCATRQETSRSQLRNCFAVAWKRITVSTRCW